MHFSVLLSYTGMQYATHDNDFMDHSDGAVINE